MKEMKVAKIVIKNIVLNIVKPSLIAGDLLFSQDFKTGINFGCYTYSDVVNVVRNNLNLMKFKLDNCAKNFTLDDCSIFYNEDNSQKVKIVKKVAVKQLKDEIFSDDLSDEDTDLFECHIAISCEIVFSSEKGKLTQFGLLDFGLPYPFELIENFS